MATKKVGFVKQHRSIMDTALWYEDSRRWKIYSTIYLMVNWKANTWTFNGEKHNLEPGQTITSYAKIAERAGSKDITYKLVRNACKYLHDEGYICLETTPRKNIKISVADWHQAQAIIEQPDETIQIGEIQYLDGAQDGAQETGYFLEAETPTRKALPALSGRNGAQFGAQFGALIEEGTLQRIKEEEATSSIGKEKEEATASPDIQIVNLYYTIKKEYHHNGPAVNIDKDIAILKKCDNRTTIIDDGPVKAEEKIRGWFHDSGDKNYEWKKGADFPFAAFCKQYHTIIAVKKRLIFKDICPDCGNAIHENEAHMCVTTEYCPDCQVAFNAKGKRGLWTIDDHDCKKEQAARQRHEEERTAGKIEVAGNPIDEIIKGIGKKISQ